MQVSAPLLRAARTTFDTGTHKLAKDCLLCGREFTWRKKWERSWPEIQNCSKRFRGEAQAARRADGR